MPTELKSQKCPICSKNTLTLREEEIDVPHFGRTYIFSMLCDGCGYRKADLEAGEQKEPCRYTFEIKDEKDLNVKIVKSGEAMLKLPNILTMEPGSASEGFITTLEGVLERVKAVLESTEEAEEDADAKKKVQNMIKKVNRAMAGQEPLKIILEDKTGNSAILSEKAERRKL